jgi:hypothetical protein
MTCWVRTLIAVYFLGLAMTIVFHGLFLQMVTFDLALVRAIVWPIFWVTGWPHGTPLTMD